MLKHLFITIFAFCSLLSTATELPEKPSKPRLVNDFASILNEYEKTELEHKLRKYNDSTSTQIAIVSMKSIGDEVASAYAPALAENWGIGQKGKDNGILILVVVDSREIFIATGYGMEGSITDARAKRIVENIIKPNFRENRFYTGLNQATDAIIAYAAGDFTADKENNNQEFSPLIFLLIIGLFILISFINRNNQGRTSPTTFSRRGAFGGGAFGGRSSGGGFGGFGGGSFGGGGAGGKW